MKRGETAPADAAALRRRAEERLRERRAKAAAPRTEDEARRLFHELEVHQIELEMQNEELRASRLEVEEGLARSSELYDFAPMGYATLAGDGIIRSVNFAGARLLGLERSRLAGRRFALFVAVDDRAAFHEFLAKALARKSEDKEACELALQREGEGRLYVQLTAASLANREPTVLLAIEDVTGRRRWEEERAELLRAAQAARAAAEAGNRSRDLFLATLSHELRNPLAPVANSLFILERAAPGSEQARRAMEVMGRQVSHMASLIDDLLDVSRITLGKIQLRREGLDLGELGRRTVEDHRSFFEKRRLRLELDLGPEPVFVNADRTRLAQAVGNLLQNAAKFCEKGGTTRVTIRKEPEAERALIRVADNGAGIAPEMLSQLFQPFMQADTTLDRSKGGLGLGLALVKGLVELHGGDIAAHSAGVGQGAEFVVRLPLAPEETTVPRVACSHSSAPCARRRVLIIEDNVDAADTLREVLEFGLHEVGVAYSGSEGLAKAREFRPEIVLCDIGLPGMDGYEVARAFRADDALRDAYLVALSGYALPEDVRKASESGFQKHVAKPPSAEELEQLLAEAPGAETAAPAGSRWRR